MVWILLSVNSEVTDYYAETVALALERLVMRRRRFLSIKSQSALAHASKDDWFFSADAVEACKLELRGFSNIILWCQGVIPKRAICDYKSRFRARILSLVERHALRKAPFCFFSCLTRCVAIMRRNTS